MKNTKSLILIALSMVLLSACGDDSSAGGHADIKKAKSLAKAFDNSTVLRKGHMPPNNSMQVSQTLRTHAPRNYSYYQMHKIGCINEDGSKELLTNLRNNTAEIIVGAQSDKALYVQENEIADCHWGSAQYSYGWNGDYKTKDVNFGRISNCESLKTRNVLKRIDNANLGGAYPSYTNRQYRQQTPPGGYNNANYWDWKRPLPSYEYEPGENETEDSYFKLQIIGRGQQQTYYSSAEGDRFDTLSGGHAVFVSRNLNPELCHKTVYYGQAIDPNRPLHIEYFLVRPEAGSQNSPNTTEI